MISFSLTFLNDSMPLARYYSLVSFPFVTRGGAAPHPQLHIADKRVVKIAKTSLHLLYFFPQYEILLFLYFFYQMRAKPIVYYAFFPQNSIIHRLLLLIFHGFFLNMKFFWLFLIFFLNIFLQPNARNTNTSCNTSQRDFL